MFSIGEKRSHILIERHPEEFIKYNKLFMSRIYPAPIRVTSTNFDPVPHWRVGCQMVALNFQTFDKGLQLNHALFSMNGRCGYVLKPDCLRYAVWNKELVKKVYLNIQVPHIYQFTSLILDILFLLDYICSAVAEIQKEIVFC